MDIPDRFDSDPVIGWRVWRLDVRPLALRSITWDDVWPEGEAMRAVCGDFFGATKPHRPDERCPAVDCICGLWAWSDEDRAVEKFDELLEIYANTWPLASQVITVAVGAVSMWGRVIEHEEGWRSELAYPYEIRIPSLKTALYNPDRVRSGLRDCYAVEVDFR